MVGVPPIQPDGIPKALKRRMMAEAAQLESDCANAMALQRYDKLPDLCVIARDGCPPAVASLLQNGRSAE